MRAIGHLPDARRARLFGDFLLGRGIKNEMEHEADGTWTVWIRDEDQVALAEPWFARFSANPEAEEFQSSAADAAKARQAEAQALEEYRKRIRTRRSIFPKFGGYGVGFLTYALIVGCAAVAVYSKLGFDREVLRHLFITDPEMGMGTRALPEVAHGEVWRLFTPMFIHFGPIHLIFNMLWLYQLGCMIEGRQSTWRLALLVVITGLLSNLAQYYITGRPTFGGMSGVVYGLAGYVWIRGKFDPGSGLFLDRQSVTMLLIWLVVCFTGMIGPVAKMAHLVGLLSGMACGWISARFTSRKQD